MRSFNVFLCPQGIEVRSAFTGEVEPAEVVPRKFGLVIFIIEDRLFAELLGEDGRDLGDVVPFFPREGEGDSKTLRTHGIVGRQLV